MDPEWNELAAWRGRRLGPVELLATVDSTNRDARRRIDAATATSGLVLVAQRQLAGHGSRGRAWVDTPGRSLALTVVLRWPAASPPVGATWLGVVAVTDLLAELGLAGTIKWPNDALVGGRKIAGVLAEFATVANAPGWIALGIGLNVGQAASDFPADLPTPPTSLALAGRTLAPPAAAKRLLEALDRRIARFEADGGAALCAAFAERLGLLGRPVVATLPDRTVEGRLLGLEADGTLVVGVERLRGGHVSALRGL